MENHPLSRKIRHTAALCHLSALVWLPITTFLLMLFLPYATMSNASWWGAFLCAISALGVLLAALCTFVVWRGTLAMHPFVDQAGRSITNFMLSGSLCLFVFTTIISLTCGVQSVPQLTAPLGIIAFGLVPVILLTLCLLIVMGSFFAYRGQIYSYSLTIHFFNE